MAGIMYDGIDLTPPSASVPTYVVKVAALAAVGNSRTNDGYSSVLGARGSSSSEIRLVSYDAATTAAPSASAMFGAADESLSAPGDDSAMCPSRMNETLPSADRTGSPMTPLTG